MPPKITDEGEAEALIVQLMERANRPYNAQMVTDHTAGRVRKVMSQKILERLVEEKRLVAKDFGKNRTYYPDQSKVPGATSETQQADKEALEQLRRETAARAVEVKDLHEVEKALAAQPSDADLAAAVARLAADAAGKGDQLEELKGTGQSLEDVSACRLCASKLRTALAKAQRRAQRRKRHLQTVVSIICEIDGTRPAVAMQRLGLTDTTT
eukprot:TRINITY_DN27593_c0_g1_i1.p1 TRINITY_DN27593_c0_g1~~TRINITY_DN27593_c0_g1_i1.p1  ORF type:complete len:212 (+),score=75.23 TRINITY_DN27593_c0_g1_i1:85-720(+)